MLGIRNYRESDIESLVMLANNEKVSRYMTTTFPYPYTREDAEWWISTGSKNGIVKVVEYNNDFVGSVGAHPNSAEKERSAMIGYWLGEPFWGKGLASEALKQLTGFIFSNTSIVRLEASIFSANTASMRVAEKAGYKCEAVLEKAIFKDGSFHNEHLYSSVKP